MRHFGEIYQQRGGFYSRGELFPFRDTAAMHSSSRPQLSRSWWTHFLSNMQDNPFTSFKRLAFLENLHTKHPIFEEHQEETMNSKTLFLDRQVHQS